MRLRDRACPICGSTDTSHVWIQAEYDETRLGEYAFASRKLPEFMSFRMVRCPVCDLLYATPAPQMEWLNGAYKNAKYNSDEEARYAARTYARYLSRILPSLVHREGTLDIGTGNGAFLEHLIGVGFKRVRGVELSMAPTQAAKKEIRPLIKFGMFCPADYEPESFSLITCFQAIEHVDDPITLCKGSFKLLEKGGAIFLVAHNYRSFSARILGRRSPIFDVEHLQLNSPVSIRSMLEWAGYERIKVYSISNTYPLYYWLKLFPLSLTIKKRLTTLLKATGFELLSIPIRAGNLAAIGFKPLL